MKVKKYELVRIIDKLKSVVQKNTVHPALGGVLVKEGYLIAANGEITIQVKCEDAEGESFIIPMKAFDLIKNLPEGDVELLHDDKNVVTIKMEKIKNSYQSFPAENFIYSKTDMESGEELTLPGKSFMEAISHVIYAAAEKEPSKKLKTEHIRCFPSKEKPRELRWKTMRILIDFALVSFGAIIGGTVIALCAISGRNRDDDEK